MKRALAIALLLVCAADPTAAQEQGDRKPDSNGFYMYLMLGVSSMWDTQTQATDETITDIEFYVPGFATTFAIGKKVTDRVRLEAEWSHSINATGTIRQGLVTYNGYGSAQVQTFMANALYEFTTGDGFVYLGGGAGLAIVNLDNVGTAFGTMADDSDSAMAFQFALGVEFKVGQRQYLMLDYRITSISKLSFVDVNGMGFTTDDGVRDSLMIGLRTQF